MALTVRGFAVETGCRATIRYEGKDAHTGEYIFGNAKVPGMKNEVLQFEVGQFQPPVLPGLHGAVLGMEGGETKSIVLKGICILHLYHIISYYIVQCDSAQ